MNDFWLEAFGYLGTFLILFSMLMTSMEKLRLFNTAGSIISMIYGILMQTWPVVFLNIGMILINLYQLFRIYRDVRKRKENSV